MACNSVRSDGIIVRMDELVAQLVTSAMDSAGLNKDQLADATGIARVTLRRRLRGNGWKISELEQVADALGTEVADFIPRLKAVAR